MNKFETLIACRNHWQWMMITGSGHKTSYLPATSWLNCCACCEYTEDDHWGACQVACPLTGYAWDEAGCCYTTVSDIGQFCSIYQEWEDNPGSENAGRMVYAINKAIEDLIINGEMEP
jgi:hypothetical protein